MNGVPEDIDDFEDMEEFAGFGDYENSVRIVVLLDHVIYQTDQLRRLKEVLIAQGIEVPIDLGTLGVPTDEVRRLHMDEVIERFGLHRPQ